MSEAWEGVRPTPKIIDFNNPVSNYTDKGLKRRAIVSLNRLRKHPPSATWAIFGLMDPQVPPGPHLSEAWEGVRPTPKKFDFNNPVSNYTNKGLQRRAIMPLNRFHIDVVLSIMVVF